MDSNKSKYEFSFNYSRNIESLIPHGSFARSPSFTVGKIDFSLYLERKVSFVSENISVSHLSVFLEAIAKPKLWSCSVKANLTLLSCKPNIRPKSRGIDMLFTFSNRRSGYQKFIDWDVMTNPNLGYAPNNTIKLSVVIVADEPKNMDPLVCETMPTSVRGWFQLFEDGFYEQIVTRISEEITATSTRDKRDLLKKVEAVYKELKDDIENLQEHIKKSDVLRVSQVTDVKQRIEQTNNIIRVIQNNMTEFKEVYNFNLDKLLEMTKATSDTVLALTLQLEESAKNEIQKTNETTRPSTRSDDLLVSELRNLKFEVRQGFLDLRKQTTDSSLNFPPPGTGN